ncbi:MAG TPA: PAS domain-containing sensor histidine kinase [Xanthobacteraceae bacterium]|jgi:two-component system nitrogen regulation sensor histidine kinase NtrY|nr:PAS domain-containing sensor histidine kinase [Xanthobacteraceae bacterium]
MTTVDQVAALDPAGITPVPFVSRLVGACAVGVALLSATATFLVLAGLTPIAPVHEVVVELLLGNVVTGLLLLAIIGREVWKVVQARRRGRAGSRLHVQIVGLFAVIAAVPTVLVSVVASTTLDRGLDRFFSTRTRAMIEQSMIVANAYVSEHAEAIRGDLLAMAFDLGRARSIFDSDRDQFQKIISAQAAGRNLSAAILLKSDGSAVDKAAVTVDKKVVLPTPDLLAEVNETEPRVALIPEDNHLAAVVKLRGYDDTYLYGARILDPRVVAQLRATQESVGEFANLEARRLGIQIAFGLMFAIIALIVLLSSAWIGLDFANRLVAPIRRLIGAANVVSTGNLDIQVPVRRSEGDLARLGETFNKMTQELRTQHEDIVRARDLIDSRRRFTEAVLAGASAGVIGVNADGRISILNRSAERLTGRSEVEVLGLPLAQVAPELAEIFEAARSGNQRLVQRQLTVTRDGQERNYSVRVTSEQATEAEHGYVITIDDITELVLAQRSSAWADIARRIAHEIKNPLTPIQLSAERLRRKYSKTISDDPAVFEQCTETIVRQVDDIKRMVDEFSRFARMPKAVVADEDVADTVRQVVFLLRVAHPDIDLDVELESESMPARFDRRLISQALTNIIKNATEAIGAVPPAELGRGRIAVRAQRDGKDVVIDVIDNGIGLPKENRARLLEPYVTTREKGTGLGLAIVGRILEEHGGRLELRDASEKTPGARGAWMQLRFGAERVSEIASEQPPLEARAAAE